MSVCGSRKKRESGAVLLTVLLMLAAMSAVAVGMVDDIRFDIRRSVNGRLQDQAQWFGLGGEAFALNAIRRAEQLTPGRNTASAPWMRAPVQLPLENGMIEASVQDGGNCFNINSVVSDEDGIFRARETGIAQYISLLDALGLNDGQRRTLAYSLADWIDSDSIPGPRGAEDYHYSGLTPSYRTAGALVADATELRAINGYTEDIYSLIRPFVCALPRADLSPLNVNTLRADQAPLLTMLVGRDQLAIDRAQGVIARRPYDGYPNIELFWADEAFRDFTPESEVRDQIGVQTRYFDLHMQVSLDEAFFAMSSVFERRPNDFALVARSFGRPE